jgi:hypothetical protein
MLKKIGMLLVMGIMAFNLAYAAPTDKLQLTQKMLTAQTDPINFATVFYGFVLANELTDASYDRKLAELFFTAPLFSLYKTAYDVNQRQAEVGCIDFRLFTGAQDDFNGFWFGKRIEHRAVTSIPVYLLMQGEDVASLQPRLVLELVKTSDGWKIQNILYPSSKTSLLDVLRHCNASH